MRAPGIGWWLAAGALLLGAHLPAAEGAGPLRWPRITVSADRHGFTEAGSGTAFQPWGFNYLGEFEHLAEDDWGTPEGWERIEKDFRAMRTLGANVVRWHLQFATFMKGPAEPDAEALAQLPRLLALAQATGLYLDLTGLGCYRRARIPAWYDALPEAERWQAQARFWDAVATACAGDPAVFCYDLMNEPVINETTPKEHPWVGGELGGFCFVQRICNRPAGREGKDVAEAWVKTVAAPIRQRDPAALVTVGVIPWAFVWATAEPVFYSPQVARHLDFASIHVYPKSGRREPELQALAKYEVGLPLVIEETFPMECSLPEWEAFRQAAHGRVAGWISHYFGHSAAEHRAGAQPGGAATADFLEYWAMRPGAVQAR